MHRIAKGQSAKRKAQRAKGKTAKPLLPRIGREEGRRWARCRSFKSAAVAPVEVHHRAF